MAKNITVSHANKKIRQLHTEAIAYRAQSRRGLLLGFLTLCVFVLIVVVEQMLAGMGIFGTDHMAADNVAICLLMLTSFISVHFWRSYSKGNRKYKESLLYIEQYEKYQHK
jgi:hypothetical protein